MLIPQSLLRSKLIDDCLGIFGLNDNLMNRLGSATAKVFLPHAVAFTDGPVVQMLSVSALEISG
jgi:hypothetical protein